MSSSILFTEDSPFTLDATEPATFRRIVTPPANTESLRPDFRGSSYVLPGHGPHRGAQKGQFKMVHDPRYVENTGIFHFSRPRKVRS